MGCEIFHAFGKSIPIIYSGKEGPGLPEEGEPPVRRAARQLGIPDERFWLEGSSENTYESAVEVKRLLDEKFAGGQSHKIILVTSAWHLPRARMAFAGQGMMVAPEPSDFRSGPRLFGPATLVPTYEALSVSSVAIREWIGILAYRLLGKL